MLNSTFACAPRSCAISLPSCGIVRIASTTRLPANCTADNASTSAFSSSASILQSGIGCSPCGNYRRGRRDRTAVHGLGDYWGGDLLGFDLDDWSRDVEEYGSIAIYTPHEGGYEGRYCTRLRNEGYVFMDVSARGLGDPEAYLTKVHGVRPAHIGKQALVCFYYPPEVDFRLSQLPKNAKGLVVYVSEAKVLSKNELQFLALLPALRKKVKVIAECGNWRKFRWKPLKEVAGLPMTKTDDTVQVSEKTVSLESKTEEKKSSVKTVA